MMLNFTNGMSPDVFLNFYQTEVQDYALAETQPGLCTGVVFIYSAHPSMARCVHLCMHITVEHSTV